MNLIVKLLISDKQHVTEALLLGFFNSVLFDGSVYICYNDYLSEYNNSYNTKLRITKSEIR